MNDANEILSLISQIKTCLPNLEGSIASVKSDIPSNLNSAIFNIRSNLSSASETLENKNIELNKVGIASNNASKVISISDDHNDQIEKYRRYLKKHLNNEIQKYFSELDSKIKKLESDFYPLYNLEESVPLSNLSMDLKNKITKSFNDFNAKSQSLCSKISDEQVKKKFDYENATNNILKTLKNQINQQENDIELLKSKIEETQIQLVKLSLKRERSENEIENKNIHLPSSNVSNMIQEQKDKIKILNAKWQNARDTLISEYSLIDNNFTSLLNTSEEIKNSINENEQKLSYMLIDNKKSEELIKSIQDRIKDEDIMLDRSTIKEDISKLGIEYLKLIEEDRIQVEELEISVNQLYDELTTRFSS
ncbi:hypothetical protein M9Y10_016410 [Tritrichomonas musculus]|uniref:Uncharacterized protein n=1 Tax=Tritrichomonas musculus TaxID=1915356 RepID=A0ABR2HW41_9EUKA